MALDEERFDVIVVGGGSAGCVVAGRLGEDRSRRVLLLEAGEPAEKNPETLRADGYREAFVNDALMWERDSVPQPALGGRRVFVGSGRGMGGSGAINAMVYTRGSAADYASWQLPGFGWEAVVRDFEALEARLGLDRHPPSRFGEAAIEAACARGFRRSEDLNDGDLSGVLGYEWMNFQGAARRNSYAAFVAGHGDNLHVATGARVHRVAIDPATRVATGVVYSDARGGAPRLARLREGGEVVLSAGALETPRLLMLSGIGPGSVLQRLGVPLVCDAPEVGRNLQDHPNVTLFFHGPSEVDATTPQVYGFHRAGLGHEELAPGQSDTCYVFYPARSSFREGLQRMLPAMTLPASLRHHPVVVRGVRGAIAGAFEQGAVQRFIEQMWGIVVILGKPLSRGTVRLTSPLPSAPLHVDPAYFADPRDLETLVRGIELARSISRSAALSAYYRRELMPGGWARSRASLEAFVRRNAMTTYHYGGTARMGTDALAPVDAESFRVRGVGGLRVADASLMPIVPVSALNAPSMLLGWRAADAIQRDKA